MKKKHLKVKISELKENKRNPKSHDLESIKASIQDIGYIDDIVIDENNEVLAGHGRLQAMQEMGETEIDAIQVTGLTDEQKERYLFLSNRIVELGGWDKAKLKEWDASFLEEMGWNSRELDAIFDLEGSEDKFDVEKELEKIKEPEAKPGDIYQLGQNRVMCGSSTSPEDVTKLMDGKQADLVFTDPPYNVAYKDAKGGGIMNDDMTDDSFIEFTMAFMEQMKRSLKEGGVFYICSGYSSYVPFLYAIKALNLTYSCPILWVKNQSSFGFADYKKKHEMMLKGGLKEGKKKAQPIMYGWNGGKHYFAEDKFEADVWEVKRKTGNTMVHPTQKPLELIGRAIRNSSQRDELVLDLFGGSGATLISAEKEGRRAYLMELDPKFVDIILKRWTKFTGSTPTKL